MFERASFNLGYIDRLSYRDSFIHRIDPRVKVIIAAAFVVSVASFPKHAVEGQMPFFILPVLFITIAEIPIGFILRRLLIASPFVVFVALFSPLMDTRPAGGLLGFTVTYGWLSCISIALKFVLTISMALLLIATTPFIAICNALRSFGMPKAFVLQLLFLYRYIFVLADEAMRMVRARELRTFDDGGRGLRSYIPMVTSLFVRTLNRAERVYHAMLSRGFSGDIRLSESAPIRLSDMLFCLLALGCITLFRLINIPEQIGRAILP